MEHISECNTTLDKIVESVDNKLLLLNDATQLSFCSMADGKITKMDYLDKTVQKIGLDDSWNATITGNGSMCEIISITTILILKWITNNNTLFLDISLNRLTDGSIINVTKKLSFNCCVKECNGTHPSPVTCSGNIESVQLQIHKLKQKNNYLITQTYPIYTPKEAKSCVFFINEQKIFVTDLLNLQLVTSQPMIQPKHDTIVLYNYKKNEITLHNILTNNQKQLSGSIVNYKILNPFTLLIEAETIEGTSKTYIVNNYDSNNDIDNTLKFNMKMENGCIILSARDNYYEYECQIKDYKQHSRIESIEELFDMIQDAISGTEESIDFKFEKQKTLVLVTITLLYKYMNGKIHFELLQKPIDKMSVIEKKIDNLVNRIK